MIRIKNELEFQDWFKRNFKKFGFSRIVRHNHKSFPDFIMQEGDKKVRVELEIKSSNFILHKHPISKVDKIICIKKDLELGIPIIELKNFKVVGSLKNTYYSLENRILKLFEKNKLLITSDVAKIFGVTPATAQRALTELVIEGKVNRIKKGVMTLWLKK